MKDQHLRSPEERKHAISPIESEGKLTLNPLPNSRSRRNSQAAVRRIYIGHLSLRDALKKR